MQVLYKIFDNYAKEVVEERVGILPRIGETLEVISDTGTSYYEVVDVLHKYREISVETGKLVSTYSVAAEFIKKEVIKES